MNTIHEAFATYEHDYTEDFDTQFGLLPKLLAYDTYLVEPQYGRDPYGIGDEDLYDQDQLEHEVNHNKPIIQIESFDLIRDSHVSDAFPFALSIL